MIAYETFCRLRQLRDEQGLKVSQIAAQLDLDPKTVAAWIERATYQQRQGKRRASKLDAFKAQIKTLVERHPYTAQQILQQLQQQGYAGGYSILKDFVRQIRPVRKPAHLMLDFAPGDCAQVDWGSFGSVPVGSTHRRLSFFVMVLCYSRMMYLEFTLAESMEQFLACHRQAFEFFQSVPARVMIDNLKVGVLSHPFGQRPVFHPRYLDLAAHYGFEPVACNVRRANEKGRVENGVGYVKKNFLAGLDLASFAAVNPAAITWRDTIANVRIHGETHRKPIDLFAEEKPRLKPLPILPYDCAVVRPVAANGCVTYGFSELYDKRSEDKAVSGWGFELTLRLKGATDSDEPPKWVLNFLQNLARYVFQSGRVFQIGDYMNANGPIAIDVDTKIRAVAFAEDPELPPIETPNGRLQFIQVVGITEDEELAIKQWATLKALGVLKQHLPMLVTDLGRESLLTKPDVKKALQDGAIADGSHTSTLFVDQLSWAEERRILRPSLIQITIGARQVVELVSLLPYRIPYSRTFELIGQQCQIAINPSEKNGYQLNDDNLSLKLSSQTANEVATALVPKEGIYEFRSFPELRIQVKRTFIKDHAGTAVRTIG